MQRLSTYLKMQSGQSCGHRPLSTGWRVMQEVILEQEAYPAHHTQLNY